MYGHIEYRVNVHKVVQQQVGFYMHFLTIIGNMGKLLNIRIPKGKFYFITWSNRTESGSIEARAYPSSSSKGSFSPSLVITKIAYKTQEAGTSEQASGPRDVPKEKKPAIQHRSAAPFSFVFTLSGRILRFPPDISNNIHITLWISLVGVKITGTLRYFGNNKGRGKYLLIMMRSTARFPPY
eukprot:TRINITY_DN2279_c0_g1_i1.p1 TRINITY_DN2279_c0_g1~~TRINITY_DN2279_c0_g1_i1.p1  ORF type:complete len:182 (-),score=1.46 TRINITY_DN2279_c0_g1_i1:211-756(-)